MPGAHLHHEHDGVEGDHGHDGVLEGRGHHELPHAVLEALLVLGHVPGQGLGADGEVDAGSLRERGGRLESRRRAAPDTEHPPPNAARLSGTPAPGWHPWAPVSSRDGSLRRRRLPDLALTCLPRYLVGTIRRLTLQAREAEAQRG